MQLPVVSNPPPNFKECGECQKCCEGWVAGTAFGIPFHPHKPCTFLQGKCLVYNFRPDVCKKFYCAWLQGLFPDWMRPDKTNTLVCVQEWSGGQYLRAIGCDAPIQKNVIEEIKKFSKEQKCAYMLVESKESKLSGPPAFIKEMTQ